MRLDLSGGRLQVVRLPLETPRAYLQTFLLAPRGATDDLAFGVRDPELTSDAAAQLE
jgi:hypothetical protein